MAFSLIKVMCLDITVSRILNIMFIIHYIVTLSYTLSYSKISYHTRTFIIKFVNTLFSLTGWWPHVAAKPAGYCTAHLSNWQF